MKKSRSLDWPKMIALLENGAQDSRAKPETRASAARTARLMKARLESEARKAE